MAYEYRVAGQTVRLEVDPNYVAVKFEPQTPRSARARATADSGFTTFSQRIEIPAEGLTLIPAAPSRLSPARPTAELNTLNRQPEVTSATPVFKVGDNKVVPSDRIIVGLSNTADAARVAAQFNLTVIEPREDGALLKIPNGADVFALCRQLDALPETTFAEPDFVTIGTHIPKFAPSDIAPARGDPLLPRQYAMTITRAVDAWAIQTGRPEIRIAILDEGIDTAHADLKASIVGTYDGIDADSYQEPNPWDGHGTACAGLAAAVGQNNEGIRGSGSGCSLLAVRIAYSANRGGNWITTNDAIARSIDWSWRNNASVLSNSWGGGAPLNAIINAFERARARGRNGLGCVIVIAAGNAAGPVTFPANIANVIAVSASNEFDEFKTRTSRDGEHFWGSCYGPEISVAAPGVHNLTTDISGRGGYDARDYDPTFNGTSSATPIVAGACGLVLSARPGLREDAVRQIIAASADKVGAAPYVNGRNDFFGYGRLNVLRAVQEATATATPVAAIAKP